MPMLPPTCTIHICNASVDMRYSLDRLSAIVRNKLGFAPLTGHLFLFLSKRGDRAKLLFWDKNGYARFYKRLEWGASTGPAWTRPKVGPAHSP